jgi:hypothetical protein
MPKVLPHGGATKTALRSVNKEAKRGPGGSQKSREQLIQALDASGVVTLFLDNLEMIVALVKGSCGSHSRM